jgi:threonine dehydrogenase-like Zn-dependent dehydrogenase
MTMPAVVLTVDKRIALHDQPRPTLRSDQVLVEVDLCGICGSDLDASQLPQVYRGDCILGHDESAHCAGHLGSGGRRALFDATPPGAARCR